jgi:hypothetical protein
MTHNPLYRRTGGPQGRSGGVGNNNNNNNNNNVFFKETHYLRKDKAVPEQDMKSYRRNSEMAPLILNHSASSKWLISSWLI